MSEISIPDPKTHGAFWWSYVTRQKMADHLHLHIAHPAVWDGLGVPYYDFEVASAKGYQGRLPNVELELLELLDQSPDLESKAGSFAAHSLVAAIYWGLASPGAARILPVDFVSRPAEVISDITFVQYVNTTGYGVSTGFDTSHYPDTGLAVSTLLSADFKPAQIVTEA